MAWRVAKSLLHLRDQVNAAFPNRSKSDDGTIGDDRHAATHSEHNPDANGVVRAMDITHDPKNGFDSYKFADELKASGDTRIYYVISNRRIWNPTISPNWRPYSGSNAHDRHVHISVVANAGLYDLEKDWVTPMLGGKSSPYPKPPSVPPTVWQTGITATVFDSIESGLKSAYGEVLQPNDIFVALPHRWSGPRPSVEVKGPRGTIIAPVKDVGPWNEEDQYWLLGARPQAESGRDLGQTHWGVRKTNLAGIDLSPKLGQLVGVNGKGVVDWRFVTSANPQPQTPAPVPAPTPAPAPAPTGYTPPALPGTKTIADLLRAIFGAITGRKT
jgi:hypothetical protein